METTIGNFFHMDFKYIFFNTIHKLNQQNILFYFFFTKQKQQASAKFKFSIFRKANLRNSGSSIGRGRSYVNYNKAFLNAFFNTAFLNTKTQEESLPAPADLT